MMTDSPGDTDTPSHRVLKLVPLAVVVLAAVLGAVLLGDRINFDTLSENRERLLAFRDSNYALSALAFVSLYVAVVAFSLPGATVLTLTGGFLFGVFPGVLFNVVGATVGAVLIFLAARLGLGDRLAARMEASDGVIRRIKAGIDANQWSMLFLIRLLPAVPFFVANLVPALVGVPLWRYAITTFLGIMPAALVFTSVGAGLDAVFANGGRPDLGILFEPRILLPILGLCALAALPVVVRVIRGRKGIE